MPSIESLLTPLISETDRNSGLGNSEDKARERINGIYGIEITDTSAFIS